MASSSVPTALVLLPLSLGAGAALVMLAMRLLEQPQPPRRKRNLSRDYMVTNTSDDPRLPNAGQMGREQVQQKMREMIPTQTEAKLGSSAMMPSMEDIVKRNEGASQDLAKLTPRDVLLRLQQGNSRFWMGVAVRPEMSAMERRALIMQQTPKVAILGCSDSRVPIEIVFDQGLGDIFVIRVAGNVFNGPVRGSIEYAVTQLKVKLVVVLGHEGCGAVRAASMLSSTASPEAVRPSDKKPSFTRRDSIKNFPERAEGLESLLEEVKAGLDSNPYIGRIVDSRARDREAVVTNVRAQMKKVMGDQAVAACVREGELLVVGAFYEISSGMVDFFELAAADLCGPCAPAPAADDA